MRCFQDANRSKKIAFPDQRPMNAKYASQFLRYFGGRFMAFESIRSDGPLTLPVVGLLHGPFQT